jgi:hypothetical protein
MAHRRPLGLEANYGAVPIKEGLSAGAFRDGYAAATGRLGAKATYRMRSIAQRLLLDATRMLRSPKA